MLTIEQKKEIIATYGGNEENSGSAEVQVALLTARIKDLQDHFKAYPKGPCEQKRSPEDGW